MVVHVLHAVFGTLHSVVVVRGDDDAVVVTPAVAQHSVVVVPREDVSPLWRCITRSLDPPTMVSTLKWAPHVRRLAWCSSFSRQ